MNARMKPTGWVRGAFRATHLKLTMSLFIAFATAITLGLGGLTSSTIASAATGSFVTVGTGSAVLAATNVARTAAATASSQDIASGSRAAKAIDGIVNGYPNTGQDDKEWSLNAQRTGWIRLTFPSAVTISKVVLYDRINLQDQVTVSNLTFSSGARVTAGSLPNNGTAKTVNFSSRTVTWVQLNITGYRSGTHANGLAEFQVWGGKAPTTPTPPTSAPVTTSTPPATTTTSAPPATTTTSAPAPTLTCQQSGATGATSSTVFTPAVTPNDAGDDTSGIQSAINSAGAAGGGTVRLPAGTLILNGHLQMKNGVKLIGAGPSTILKAGPGFLNTTGPADGYPIVTTAGADNVTLQGFTADQSGNTLNGNSVSDRLAEYLIDVRNTNNGIVDDVHTINPFTYSIVSVGSTRVCIRNSSTRVTSVGKYDQLDGIHIMNSSYVDVLNNDVDQRAGGSLADGDDGLVAHTIGSTQVHHVSFIGNKVRGGYNGAGIDLAGGSAAIHDIIVQDNEIYGSTRGFEDSYYDGTTAMHHILITGNLIRDRVYGGVGDDGAIHFEKRPTYTEISGNTCANAGAIVLAAGGTGNVLSNNTMR